MKRASHSRTQGFTVVELVIVIIIIGILATITVIAFRGARERTIAASLRSDALNAASTAEDARTANGSYPANGDDFSVSGTNVLTYNLRSYGFCIVATSPELSDVSYRLKSTEREAVEGDCNVNVSTPAGSGTAGFADGTGSAAQFSSPVGVEVGPDGSIYVGDTGNHRIRKISPEGVVTTFAGSGTVGSADGTGTAAQFSSPRGIVFDKSGNLYVADTGNYRIRKITPGGVVTTIAGSTSGFLNGIGTAARFVNPIGIAIDSSGNLYIGDGTGRRVRKIDTNMNVTTFAGTGSAGTLDGISTVAQFSGPQGMAFDSNGNLYVADSSNHRIRKITPAGTVSTLVGSTSGYANGDAATARFSTPSDLDIDADDYLYVIDLANSRVRKVSPTGDVTTFAGSPSSIIIDGVGTNSSLNLPQGIALNANETLMYVADRDNDAIRKIEM